MVMFKGILIGFVLLGIAFLSLFYDPSNIADRIMNEDDSDDGFDDSEDS